jgi:hypothetical protein
MTGIIGLLGSSLRSTEALRGFSAVLEEAQRSFVWMMETARQDSVEGVDTLPVLICVCKRCC